jgi:hypothetical protein
MKARSADYIRLQNVYRAKARKDLAEVLATVRETEERLGRSSTPVDEREVEAFCKGAAFVKLIRGRPLHLPAAAAAAASAAAAAAAATSQPETSDAADSPWRDMAKYVCKLSPRSFSSRVENPPLRSELISCTIFGGGGK